MRPPLKLHFAAGESVGDGHTLVAQADKPGDITFSRAFITTLLFSVTRVPWYFRDAYGIAAEADGNGSRKPYRKVASFPGTGSPPEHAGEGVRCRSRGRSNRFQRSKSRAGRRGAGNFDRPVRWVP